MNRQRQDRTARPNLLTRRPAALAHLAYSEEVRSRWKKFIRGYECLDYLGRDLHKHSKRPEPEQHLLSHRCARQMRSRLARTARLHRQAVERELSGQVDCLEP